MIKIVFALVLSALANSEGHIVHACRWPSGKYCLPMPHDKHCPLGWAKGYRYHDTEDSRNANGKGGYVPYIFFGRNIEWGFCCKRKDHFRQSYVPWPKGQYCIFRKGGSCPRGFNVGRMHWDDEDKSNENRASGTLPDGIYNRNTDIYFCCRNDGSRGLKLQGKRFPRCNRLILMRYNNACPIVPSYRGPYTGYLEWDNEDRKNEDKRLGAYPDGVSSLGSGIKIEFCTYKSSGIC